MTMTPDTMAGAVPPKAVPPSKAKSQKRSKRHTPEQIVAKLRDADAMLNSGKDVAAVLQSLLALRVPAAITAGRSG